LLICYISSLRKQSACDSSDSRLMGVGGAGGGHDIFLISTHPRSEQPPRFL